MSPESPRPNSVNARPEAFWLAANTRVTMPNRPPIAAPERTPASTPTIGMPLTCPPAKPMTAPTAIIPSTPRLSTPERSAINSPRAANNNGVAAVMMVSRMPSAISIGSLRRFG